MDEVGPPSTIFVYNDAVGHVTQFQPPDWLLLCTSNTPWKARLFGFPRRSLMAAEAL